MPGVRDERVAHGDPLVREKKVVRGAWCVARGSHHPDRVTRD